MALGACHGQSLGPGSLASGWGGCEDAPRPHDTVMPGEGCAPLALTWSCVDSDTDLPCTPQLPSEAP